MNELLKILGKDKYIFSIPSINLIAVFDHYFYSRNDYDSLSSNQRNHIINKLKSIGFTQKSGKFLNSNDYKSQVQLLSPPSLGVSPLIELERIYNADDIFVVSPTTYAHFVIQNRNLVDQIKIDILQKLITKCPINLEQLKDFSQNTEYQNFVTNSFQKLNVFQKQIVKDNFEGKKIRL